MQAEIVHQSLTVVKVTAVQLALVAALWGGAVCPARSAYPVAHISGHTVTGLFDNTDWNQVTGVCVD